MKLTLARLATMTMVLFLFISACAPTGPQNLWDINDPTPYPSQGGDYNLVITPVTPEEALHPEQYGSGNNVVYYLVNEIASYNDNSLSLLVVPVENYSSTDLTGFAIGVSPRYFKVAGTAPDIDWLMKSLCQTTAEKKGVSTPKCR